MGPEPRGGPDGASNKPYLNANQPTEFVAVDRHFLETSQGVANAERQLPRGAVQSGRRLRLFQQFKKQILKLDVHFPDGRAARIEAKAFALARSTIASKTASLFAKLTSPSSLRMGPLFTLMKWIFALAPLVVALLGLALRLKQ